jgi:hypothetical protein
MQGSAQLRLRGERSWFRFWLWRGVWLGWGSGVWWGEGGGGRMARGSRLRRWGWRWGRWGLLTTEDSHSRFVSKSSQCLLHSRLGWSVPSKRLLLCVFSFSLSSFLYQSNSQVHAKRRYPYSQSLSNSKILSRFVVNYQNLLLECCQTLHSVSIYRLACWRSVWSLH